MKLVFLAVCLGMATAYSGEYMDEVDIAIAQVRNFLNTEGGVGVAREFFRRLDDGHPILFMVKAFVASSSDQSLKNLLNELMKDIPQMETQEGVDVHELFLKLHYFLVSEEGPHAVKEYFENLQTSDPVAKHIKHLIVNADPDDLKEIIEAVLPPVYYEGEVKAELRSLFREIRKTLITPEGIEAVREFARTVQPTHPALFLIKGFIQSADDKVLLEILDEVFKDFDYAEYESASEKLERLFLRVRELLQTKEGFQAIKSFLLNIKSDHAIVSRVHAFISLASDDTLREILDALFGDL